MSDYNRRSSYWQGKDSLSDSDPEKIISGDDFDDEFELIETAVNTKADVNGNAAESFSCDNLTIAGDLSITGAAGLGSATATTQATGDDSTKVATTAFVQQEITANAYTLPAATSSTLGGVKVSLSGSTLTISTT